MVSKLQLKKNVQEPVNEVIEYGTRKLQPGLDLDFRSSVIMTATVIHHIGIQVKGLGSRIWH